MEIDILNEIITISVFDLFNPSASSQQPTLTLPNFPQQQPKLVSTNSAPPSYSKTENPSAPLIKRISLEPFRNEDESRRKSIESLSRTSDRSLENPNSATLKSPLLNTEHESSSQRRSRDSLDSGSTELTTAHSSQENPQRQLHNLANSKTPPTLDQWLGNFGPQKLNESLGRLNLNLNNMNKLNLSGLSKKQLENEKKNVKHELKRYDASFVELFKRMPNREEKEPMKPLYIYYKRLKQYISLADGEEEKSNLPAEGSKLNSLNNISVDSDKNQRATATATANSVNRIGSYTLKEKENKSMMDAAGTGTLYGTQKNLASISLDRDLVSANKNVVPNQEAFKKKMTKEEAQRRLDILDAVKSQMREKLHAYQVEFTKNNNRKIKYHKDIIPVEEEYKRYKEVKDEIAMLEDFLKNPN